MYRMSIDESPLDSVLPMLEGVAQLVGPNAPIEELATCEAALDPGALWNAARLDRAPRLRVLSRIGVGYDNIDVQAATERGIIHVWLTGGLLHRTAVAISQFGVAGMAEDQIDDDAMRQS